MGCPDFRGLNININGAMNKCPKYQLLSESYNIARL